MLPVITSPQQSLDDGAVVIRDDKEGKTTTASTTGRAATPPRPTPAFEQADRIVTLETHYPRSHPAPLETCGCLADVNSVTGQATIYMTSQAPHAHRTVFAMVSGLPEQNIRIISPDIGGGFGNKVPVYPGYVIATAASLVLQQAGEVGGEPHREPDLHRVRPRLLHEGRAGGHERGAHPRPARRDAERPGRVLQPTRSPSQFRAGLFHVVTGSYDYPAAYVKSSGAYTNKAPGGVAYRCSFRITEASFLIERLVQTAAYELGIDPAEFRFKNFIQPEQFPYKTPTGFVYDSGDYPAALRKALDSVGYEQLREEQAQAREAGRLMGIGIAHFTEAVGAGPSKKYDILGLKMIDSAELRVHPTGKAILKMGVKSQGQGHATTFAQIVADELGIPSTDVKVVEGDTDNTPYGLGTYASALHAGGRVRRRRSWRARSPRRRRRSPRTCSRRRDADIELENGVFSVAGSPERTRHHPGRRARRRTPTCPTAWSTGSRTCTTTTRRTSPIPTAATWWWSTSTPRPVCGRCGGWSRSTTAACGSTR